MANEFRGSTLWNVFCLTIMRIFTVFIKQVYCWCCIKPLHTSIFVITIVMIQFIWLLTFFYEQFSTNKNSVCCYLLKGLKTMFQDLSVPQKVEMLLIIAFVIIHVKRWNIEGISPLGFTSWLGCHGNPSLFEPLSLWTSSAIQNKMFTQERTLQ